MMNMKNKKAQTALELAIFGSILIFVLGTIIRAAVNRGNQQQASLRATRMALGLSHATTETKRVAGRNMANVLIVEDRLTTASAKYGAIDRMPFMTQGSGMHTVNLFMPPDYPDIEDLPVFDMFVNGQHFPFTTAGFKRVYLANTCRADCAGDTYNDCDRDSLGQCVGSMRGGDDHTYYAEDDGYCPGQWEKNCLEHQEFRTEWRSCAGVSPCPFMCSAYGGGGCEASTNQRYRVQVPGERYIMGCAKMYTIVENHPLIDAWCDDVARPCPADCSTNPGEGCNLSADDRFNLDRVDAAHPSGLDGLGGRVDVPGTERENFSWQWFMVMGATVGSSLDERTPTFDYAALQAAPGDSLEDSVSTLIMAEGITLPGGEAKSKNIALDVDCDLKEEYIMPSVDENNVHPNAVDRGVITYIGVQDPHEGDVDFTYNSRDELKGLEQFGFTKDVRLYTYVRDENNISNEGGTYFQIDEGHLFAGSGDDRQFIRTASKKDQVDLIERVWRLSNNTHGYCREDGTPRPSGTGPGQFGAFYYGVSANPVEACTSGGGCYSSDNVNKTCMDLDNNIILIRSRIQDLHGRKWVTDMGSDPYVNFVIN